jgi:galactokinase
MQIVDKYKIENSLKMIQYVKAPGRMNLIGEHTDYSGGKVLPFSIDACIEIKLYELSEDAKHSKLVLQSTDFPGALSVSMNELDMLGDNEESILSSMPKDIKEHWSSYALGALYYVHKNLKEEVRKSYLIEIDSTLPAGAGISSSAALSTGLLSILYRELDIDKAKETIAKEAMKIEHFFTGTKCGQMDQLAVMMPKENHLISVDFENFNEDMSFILQQVETHNSFKNYTIVGLNTGVQHKLSDSPYNQRREACELLLKLIKKKFDLNIPALGSLAKDDYIEQVFFDKKEDLSQDLIKAKLENMGLEYIDDRTAAFGSHAIWENIRVDIAVKALCEGDFKKLDKAMNESHLSLRNEYQVSCDELDLIRVVAQEKADELSKDKSMTEPAIIGPRMTGGGFGGSTIQLVHNDILDKFIAYFNDEKNAYQLKTKIKPSSIVTKLSAGLRFI